MRKPIEDIPKSAQKNSAKITRNNGNTEKVDAEDEVNSGNKVDAKNNKLIKKSVTKNRRKCKDGIG